tara:strand:- start:682 stop:864 length:183 start_codon:yes stop_codon:yes gene_type:complete
MKKKELKVGALVKSQEGGSPGLVYKIMGSYFWVEWTRTGHREWFANHWETWTYISLVSSP